MRRILPVLLLTISAFAAAASAAAADDPVPAKAAYDAVLAAHKAERWDELLETGPAFLAAHPTYVHAHSVLYMVCGAQFSTRRFEDCVASCERYARDFPGKSYAERTAYRRAESLFKLRRGAAAKAAFAEFLASHPGSTRASGAKDYLARIDPVEREVRGRVVLDYEGKYAADDRFRARTAEVVRLVPTAVRTVRERLGLGSRAEPRFVVRFADLGNRTSSVHMESMEEIRGEKVAQRLVVSAEPLVLGLYDLETTLVHEILHCWHRDSLGEPYYRVPKWVREGLALWAARQGPQRAKAVYVALASNPDQDPVARIANGLAGKHTFDDYLEDWLAFDHLERSKGVLAVQALARGLFASAEVEAEFAKAWGKPFADFEAVARAAAEARVRSDLADRPRYVEAKRHYVGKKWAEAAKAYEALLTASPDHVLGPRARREWGGALVETGAYDRAREVLLDVEKRDPHGVLRDDVAYELTRIAALKGDAAEARRLGEAFLRDYSWASAGYLKRIREILAAPSAAPEDTPPGEAPAKPVDDGGEGDD